jgi:phosphotriesterase-related protein
VVETVLGPVTPGDLGLTLMHEHLFVGDHELERVFPERYGRDRDEAVTAVENALRIAHACGVRTIVDQTVMGLGRDIDLIRRAAEKTPINIVVATGAYVLRDLPNPLQLRGPGRTAFGGPEPLVELFVRELQDGIGGTPVKTGLIKVASDRFGITPDVERVLRAAARAHLETGALISTHTNARSRGGLDQQRIFREEGVELRRCLIGHTGDTDDRDYHNVLLAAGSFLGMDRFGLDYFLSHERRVAAVASLCRAGHANRLVLSHDATCHSIAFTQAEMNELAPHSHWGHLMADVVPDLLSAGVSAGDLEQMLVLNPATMLERQT